MPSIGGLNAGQKHLNIDRIAEPAYLTLRWDIG
jgi:hypothetical protein